MAFGQLEDEVPGVPNETPAGLEQALLQARQRPVLDGERQDQSTQEIAEVVGDDPEEQPHLVGPEAVTGEPRPMSGFFVAHVRWGMRGDKDPDGTPRQPRNGVMMQVLMKGDGKWAVVAAQNTNVR